MNLLSAVTDTLATVRLTRLVLDDEITESLRTAALDALVSLGEDRPELKTLTDKLEYLLSCPWCVSAWAAGLLLLLRRVDPKTADLVSGALAASLITGVIYPRITP